ncbi:hypothetical protein [Methanofollis fontis]|uniref:Uncharacterized protein n=1 Tax=Methanofollis fontis TaxID=2052832 RepID=A0A483CTD1_9EURY|nr:hypothetical protein [Methanofollis fontis]TAJ45614.1 hypothetical protein CUJ86_02510 [Methanofollis fontis]
MLCRTGAIIVVCLLLAAPVCAAQGNGQGAGGAGGPGGQVGGNQTQAGDAAPPGLQKHLRDEINGSSARFDAEAGNLSGPARIAVQNQNSVRVAVQALLAFGEMDGGIGRNISAFARQYNASIQTRLAAEERIHARPGYARFFFGGDDEGAAVLLEEVNQSGVQIREMERLVANCTCDDATRAVLMEQIGVMEAEQERLRLLAEGERSDTGLIGWIWR